MCVCVSYVCVPNKIVYTQWTILAVFSTTFNCVLGYNTVNICTVPFCCDVLSLQFSRIFHFIQLLCIDLFSYFFSIKHIQHTVNNFCFFSSTIHFISFAWLVRNNCEIWSALVMCFFCLWFFFSAPFYVYRFIQLIFVHFQIHSPGRRDINWHDESDEKKNYDTIK